MTNKESTNTNVRTALMLIGGHGTRLRPLTISTPKPFIHFCNRPLIEYIMEQFVEIGVNRFILACGKRTYVDIADNIEKIAKKLNVVVIFSIEAFPLGTGGPLRLAEPHLAEDETFFVLNTDIVADLPLDDMVKAQRQHGGMGTILAAEVPDPSAFGVLVTTPTEHDSTMDMITSFVEKPRESVSNKINGGVYLLRRDVIDLIPRDEVVSIERRVFPQIIERQLGLYSVPVRGYWVDVGKPSDFLRGQDHVLRHRAQSEGQGKRSDDGCSLLEEKEGIIVHGNVLVHESSIVERSSVIGPNVVIGRNCKIESTCRLKNCTVMENTVVEAGCVIADAIIARDCYIKRWSRVMNGAIVADDVYVESERILNGSMILPNKTIKNDYLTKGEVII